MVCSDRADDGLEITGVISSLVIICPPIGIRFSARGRVDTNY
jgi:hypothetical protein